MVAARSRSSGRVTEPSKRPPSVLAAPLVVAKAAIGDVTACVPRGMNRVRMPLLACASGMADEVRNFAAAEVFAPTDGLEMGWVAAAPITAQVIQILPDRDGTDERRIEQPMRQDRWPLPPPDRDIAIRRGDIASRPAAVWGDLERWKIISRSSIR